MPSCDSVQYPAPCTRRCMAWQRIKPFLKEAAPTVKCNKHPWSELSPLCFCEELPIGDHELLNTEKGLLGDLLVAVRHQPHNL